MAFYFGIGSPSVCKLGTGGRHAFTICLSATNGPLRTGYMMKLLNESAVLAAAAAGVMK